MYVDPIVVKILLVAFAATFSVNVALVSGILARADGATVAAAVRLGGAAFAGSLTVAILILSAVGAL